MNVRDAAIQLGVTPRRVRAMIADGRIPASRSGSTWVIDALAPVKSRRALSTRSWALLAGALKQRTLDGLTGHDRARTAERIRQLRESDHPSQLLADWRPSAAKRDAFMDSLTAHAQSQDDAYIKRALRPRPEYLRSAFDLAQVVRSERAIRRESRERLAEASGVPEAMVRDIEMRHPLSSPSDVRSVLRALDIEPTALPDMMLS
jgi:excisionase family DNA binding protein